jgi:hypothetical protein
MLGCGDERFSRSWLDEFISPLLLAIVVTFEHLLSGSNVANT